MESCRHVLLTRGAGEGLRPGTKTASTAAAGGLSYCRMCPCQMLSFSTKRTGLCVLLKKGKM